MTQQSIISQRRGIITQVVTPSDKVIIPPRDRKEPFPVTVRLRLRTVGIIVVTIDTTINMILFTGRFQW